MSTSTADILRTAATIADRLAAKGEPCSPAEAIARAEAAREESDRLKALMAEQLPA